MSGERSLEEAFAQAVAARPGAPGRAEILAALERRAAELDAWAARSRTVEHLAEEAARRRTLLIELDVAGLLSGADARAMRAELERLPTLRAYHAAALALSHYLGGAVRRRSIPDATPEPIRGAPVSVDWFRLGPRTPPGADPEAWTVLGESLLRGARLEGPEGEFAAQADGRWYEVHWRADDARTPALLELRRA
jgi:hypothetical protein